MLSKLKPLRWRAVLAEVAKMPYYAVRFGRKPGIYSTWDDCKAQVERFPKARYKKFNSEWEASAFISGYDNPTEMASDMKDDYYFETGTGAARHYSPIMHSAHDHRVHNRSHPYAQRNFSTSSRSSVSSTSSSSSCSSSSSSSGGSGIRGRRTRLIDVCNIPQSNSSSGSSGGLIGKTASVYTDGACTNNGRNGSRAGIGVYWGPGHAMNVSERLSGRQTNNRAEIHAVIKAAEQAKSRGVEVLDVHTDSQFLINAMTKWIHGWKKNGWKVAKGADVANREDFQQLEKASRNLKINWHHVRGHKGIEGNECADRLAVEGASRPLRGSNA